MRSTTESPPLRRRGLRWLVRSWALPFSLGACAVMWGPPAAADTRYDATFCNPFCLTESKDSPQTKITFSGLPSFFTGSGVDFIDSNFKGSFAVDPQGSPLKSGMITSLQYIAHASHDAFDGITYNGPYVFLRGLNEDTTGEAQLYFAFRLEDPLDQAFPTVGFIPNTDGDNPSDGGLISNASYSCRLTNGGGPQNCKSGGDYYGLQTGTDDFIRVPGPLPMLGIGSAIVWSRKLKSRYSSSTPIANQQNNQPG